MLRLGILAALLAPGLSQAGFVNGDFETGDLTGWLVDTDGNGAPNPVSPDFQVVDVAGDKKGRVEADYWSVPGNDASTPLDQVFISNTLYQDLDTTAAAGFELFLSFDWDFNGQNTGGPDEDIAIGFTGSPPGDFFGADGKKGFLVSSNSYGSGSYAGVLDSSFNNAALWSLDFQINSGTDAFGSYLQIDNVTIVARPAAAPEPAFLFAPALALLAGFRRRSAKRAAA